jgi:type I restriction enzyme R subunit
MMKNPERIDEIAKYIANHYKNNVELLGYKAFVVAVDREACVLYKDALNKYLPESYSEVIMSYSNNDNEKMKKYYKSEDQEKEIRKKFQNPDEDPKILIVTDKLLTGFDAPILYAMYLDKPMRDHVLLQAIARINRPYEYNNRIKKYGFIMDFVGVFGSLKKALAFDSSDIKDLEGVLKDIDELKKEFKNIIESMEKQYLKTINERSRDKIIENILEIFRDPEKREDYLDKYSRLSDIYDILSPDKFLSGYESLYKDLTNIYNILLKTYGHENSKYYDLSRKTAELVKNNTVHSKIPDDLKTYEINDETINKIRKSRESDREKVFNLLISIKKYIDENKMDSPFLISIGERAYQIAESYNNNIKSSEEILSKIYDMINDINKSNKEKK